MMLTEQEAREKHCCGPKNRCIASECMAWRWGGRKVETRIVGTDTWSIASPPQGWRYVVSYDDGMAKFDRCLSSAERVGFCGLAGRPEVG